MKLRLLLILLIIFSAFLILNRELCADSSAQITVPEFKDYPVYEEFKGKNADIKLSREDRVFRTRLRAAAKQKPNFAGHYILTYWGCGAECLMGGVIDAKSGEIFSIPFTICCWASSDNVYGDYKPIDFRIDSKLIVFTGARDEKDGDDGKHYYIFDGKRFVHLTSKIGVFPKRKLPHASDISTKKENPALQFKDYPVVEKPFTGKNAPVKLSRKDLIFKTRIRKAAKKKPNFAGHYILAAWGCGMSCLTSVIVDAKTGKVYPTPFFLSWGLDYSNNFEPIDFRMDSKLIIFTGVRDEKEGDDGTHYYVFDGHRFVHLLSRIGDYPREDIPDNLPE